MNTELLKKTQSAIIAVANKNGIDLKAQFGTKEKFGDFVVFATIQALMDQGGFAFRDAYDAVMGSGEFQRLSDAVWEMNAAQP
jgi:hypothetical protein